MEGKSRSRSKSGRKSRRTKGGAEAKERAKSEKMAARGGGGGVLSYRSNKYGLQTKGRILWTGEIGRRTEREPARSAAARPRLWTDWTVKEVLVRKGSRTERKERTSISRQQRDASLVHLGIRCPHPSLALLHAFWRSDDVVLRD